MPPHDVYIESHLGGAAVMKRKPSAMHLIGIDLEAAAIGDFSGDDPVERVGMLQSLPCPVRLAGYRSRRYNRRLSDWRCRQVPVMNQAGDFRSETARSMGRSTVSRELRRNAGQRGVSSKTGAAPGRWRLGVTRDHLPDGVA